MNYKDRTEEIAELTALNEEEQSTYNELNTQLHQEYDELKETEKSLHHIQGQIRQKEMDTRNLNNRINNRRYQINSYSKEQVLFDRQQEISEIIEQHPNFLHLLELHYKDVEQGHNSGKKLPLENTVDADAFIEKLKKMEDVEFIKTHGMDRAFMVLDQYKNDYKQQVERIAEEHIDGMGAGTFSYDDFEPMLRSFTKNAHIRRYLGV